MISTRSTRCNLDLGQGQIQRASSVSLADLNEGKQLDARTIGRPVSIESAAQNTVYFRVDAGDLARRASQGCDLHKPAIGCQRRRRGLEVKTYHRRRGKNTHNSILLHRILSIASLLPVDDSRRH